MSIRIRKLRKISLKTLNTSLVGMYLPQRPENTLKRTILEANFMKLVVPSLNEQLQSSVLMLLRNGVTLRHIL